MSGIRIYGQRSSRGFGPIRFPPRDPEPEAEVKTSHWTQEQIEAHFGKTAKTKEEKTMNKQPIDISQFDIVPMLFTRQSPAPTVTITDGGKIALNAAFVKMASAKRVSIRISKDAKILLFMPAEDGEFHIPTYAGNVAKGNTCNRGAAPLRDMAKARGLPIPAKFSCEWDEDVGGFVGRYIEPAYLAPKPAARPVRRK